MQPYNRAATIVFFILSLTAHAQNAAKKPIAIEDFASWQKLEHPIISNDGKSISFEINPEKGDGNLVVTTSDSKKEDRIERGYAAQFSPESDYIVYKIKQPEDSVRRAQKKKLKPDQMPKDSLGIFVFKKHKFYRFANLKEFQLPQENGNWLAFLAEEKKPGKNDSKENKPATQKKPDKKEEANRGKTYRLTLFHATNGDTLNFSRVTEFSYASLGNTIAFVRQTNDSISQCEVVLFDTRKAQSKSFFSRQGLAKGLVCDHQGGKIGFLFSSDTARVKTFRLYYGTVASGEARMVVSDESQGMPLGWAPSEFGGLSFSENGERLFFGTNEAPQPEQKDTLLPDEKPVLDVWSWTDKELQPEQKINLEKEKKRNYLAVYLISKNQFIQLADPEIREVQTIQKGNGKIALGINRLPYQLESSWTGDANADFYLIDVETGMKRLILKKQSSVWLSPAGNYLAWYNPADSAYYACSTESNKTDSINLTKQIPVAFCDENWDMPASPRPYGLAGWSENDKYLFLYDRFDIWRVDPEGKKVPVNATRNYGGKNFLRLRYQKLNPEEEFIDTGKPAVVSAFDERTRASGFFAADLRNYTDPQLLLMEDKKLDALRKAKNADAVIWTREDFDEPPAVWTASANFTHRQKLSETNSQQKQFIWPGVRLMHWTSFDGKPLEGLLYYPENIDLQKQYPMIVYFYERNADFLHAYIEPSPTRSTINRTFYTSNGYLIFVPDIRYTNGYPGQSAFDAVVSGTQFVSNMFPFIDRKHIGIQGQSWGGYQVAWLVTQTNMFAAAMAGAPVSNMTSAYGGIRWESGLSREFQYEQSQSRIGGTLWDKPLQYIENSPIFFVPKIKTPLLIMHNDDDGAVPWYQGIELFSALRRLQKPSWMLSYNGEPHNLKAESWANRMDLTIRMKEFFDHYLKDAPMPPWMRFGIPALKKGTETGY
jgi:dipeptidyl aminopeptidase/acylaminoacyl peptidase